MTTPVPSQPAAKSPPAKGRRQQPRRQHQPYRRTSAVIDDRPDGSPIIFGYGRHMTRKEKERAKQRIAYVALGAVVVISVVIVAFAAFYNAFIYPNQSVASVNGHGISRHDRDTFANYASAASTANGQTLPTDAATYANETLQKQLLTKLEAAQLLHLSVTHAEANTALNAQIKSSGSGTFNQFLTRYGLSKDDYTNMLVAPTLIRSKVVNYLLRGKPKVAEMWHYARIQVATQKQALAILQQLVPSGTTPVSKTVTFASLAKSKSIDAQTNTNGGDLGWQRLSDATATGGDSLLVPAFLPTLKQMEKLHTRYQVVRYANSWYVLDFEGHDLKHPISQQQLQADQAAAFNAWYGPLEKKAVFDPPLPANTGLPSAAQGASSTGNAL